MGGIIMLCILAYVLIFGVCAAIICLLPDNIGLSLFNPRVLYENWQVNWFGAYFLGILFSVLFAPLSIWYWIYKLCTVGRK